MQLEAGVGIVQGVAKESPELADAIADRLGMHAEYARHRRGAPALVEERGKRRGHSLAARGSESREGPEPCAREVAERLARCEQGERREMIVGPAAACRQGASANRREYVERTPP